MTSKVIGILVVAVILYWIDMPTLRKQRNKKDIAMFLILLTIAIVLGLAKIFKLYTSTPLYMISWLFKPLSDIIRMLQ
ncbi:hypothetical protein [Paenibacillus sp. 1001270B_150601_E10]|uniref:hypothetical protein n=1 Tax=Paenibacillus sp. 1001270B_150601_E10 TaxID=2787079 RepID=UPI0018A0D78E|nr:hypothetical protein [Paenibacillus sp. 1001270B_150601_E10]